MIAFTQPNNMFDSSAHCLSRLTGMYLYLFLLFVPGTRGKGYKGDIAIDDLSIAFKPSCSLYGGSLPAAGSTVAPVTTAAPNNCLASQFACVSDGKCIQLGQVCDFNLDCVDGSDERSCRKCYNIICSEGMNPLAFAFLVVTQP